MQLRKQKLRPNMISEGLKEGGGDFKQAERKANFFLWYQWSLAPIKMWEIKRSYVDVIFQTNKVLDTGVAGFIASFRASWYRGAILRTETALAVIRFMARRLRTKTLKSNTGPQVGAVLWYLASVIWHVPTEQYRVTIHNGKTYRWQKSSLREVFTVVNCHLVILQFVNIDVHLDSP